MMGNMLRVVIFTVGFHNYNATIADIVYCAGGKCPGAVTIGQTVNKDKTIIIIAKNHLERLPVTWEASIFAVVNVE